MCPLQNKCKSSESLVIQWQSLGEKKMCGDKNCTNIVNGVTTHFYIYIFIFHLCSYLHDGFCSRLLPPPITQTLCANFQHFKLLCECECEHEWQNGPNSKSYGLFVCASMKFIRQINGFVRASCSHIAHTFSIHTNTHCSLSLRQLWLFCTSDSVFCYAIHCLCNMHKWIFSLQWRALR